MANHGAKVLDRLRAHLKIEVGETTRDGRVTLERTYCVGTCPVGPSLVVDGDVIGRVRPDQIPALLEEYQ